MNPEHPELPLSSSSISRPVLITAVLGFNCWLTAVALPGWHLSRIGEVGLWASIFAGASLAGLVLGVALLARRRQEGALTLLVLFPLLSLAPAAFQPTLVRASVLSPPAVAVAGLSFTAHLIGACWACGAAQVREVEGSMNPLEEGSPRRRRRSLPVVLTLLAAAILVVVIGTAHLQPFAPSSDRVRLLSMAAFVLWATALFAIIAPALRHGRPWPLAKASRGAAVVWLLVVALGAIMLALAMSH